MPPGRSAARLTDPRGSLGRTARSPAVVEMP
jgi:hypothetical protein